MISRRGGVAARAILRRMDLLKQQDPELYWSPDNIARGIPYKKEYGKICGYNIRNIGEHLAKNNQLERAVVKASQEYIGFRLPFSGTRETGPFIPLDERDERKSRYILESLLLLSDKDKELYWNAFHISLTLPFPKYRGINNAKVHELMHNIANQGWAAIAEIDHGSGYFLVSRYVLTNCCIRLSLTE